MQTIYFLKVHHLVMIMTETKSYKKTNTKTKTQTKTNTKCLLNGERLTPPRWLTTDENCRWHCGMQMESRPTGFLKREEHQPLSLEHNVSKLTVWHKKNVEIFSFTFSCTPYCARVTESRTSVVSRLLHVRLLEKVKILASTIFMSIIRFLLPLIKQFIKGISLLS